jgi:phosphoesterase RecJ-like protein
LDPHYRIRHIDPDKLYQKENKTVIVVDNSDIPRIGDIATYINSDRSNLIVIDHHDGIEDFPGLYCFPEVGSTSEIIFDLMEAAEIIPDYNISYSLLAGIIVDTGQFKYKKTRPRTHTIVAKILSLHAIPQEELIRKLFEDSSHKVLLLRRDIYSTLQVFPEYQLACIEVSRSNLQKHGFIVNPAEGMTSELLAAADISISVSFVEHDSGTVKLSFRSKGKFNVCNVAKEFSGGGHENAAGAMIKGAMPEVKKMIIEKLKKLFTETKHAV